MMVMVVKMKMMARAGGSTESPRDHVTTPRAETMHPDLALKNQALLNFVFKKIFFFYNK